MLMPSPYHEEHDGYLDRAIFHTGHAQDHRDRPRGHRASTRWQTFPPHLSVGEMSISGERKFTGMLHDLTCARSARGAVARQRGALAVGHRIRRGRHRRHRCARPHRSLQPGGRATVRLRRADVIGRNVNMLMPSPYHEEHDHLSRPLSRDRGCRRLSARAAKSPGCAGTAPRSHSISRWGR